MSVPACQPYRALSSSEMTSGAAMKPKPAKRQAPSVSKPALLICAPREMGMQALASRWSTLARTVFPAVWSAPWGEVA